MHTKHNYGKNFKNYQFGVCVQGDIYTRQKCPICNKIMVHDSKRKGCFCTDHPRIPADRFFIRFPGGIYKNFTSYAAADQELSYLRHEKNSRKNFNPDDYRSARPNSFRVLKEKYLDRKKGLKNFQGIKRYIEMADNHFGLTNIKDINGADIEDYLFSIPNISEKTRANHSSQLHDFWVWALKRGNIIGLAEMPIFPNIKYDLGRRKLTDWHTQQAVIEKVYELTNHFNPKIWFGIDLLAVHTALRPGDLCRVKESSIDIETGYLIIHDPTKKKNKFKTIKMLDRHIEIWADLQTQFPAVSDVNFFRHTTKTKGGTKPDTPFDRKYLLKWWNAACVEIGLEGVPLYPGTKHTTATETAKLLGKDKALAASGLTNKAFERYCDIEDGEAFEVVKAIEKKRSEVINLADRKRK